MSRSEQSRLYGGSAVSEVSYGSKQDNEQPISWRNISISLINLHKSETKAKACAIAFHEKAGRSQVGSLLFLLDKVFSCRVATVAILPSALSMSGFFARCKLGVLVSAGAAT